MTERPMSSASTAKIRVIQSKMLMVAEEVRLAEAVLDLSKDERWTTVAKRLEGRLNRLLGELTTQGIEDRERSFLSGAVREIRLVLRTPDDLRDGPRSIKSMLATAEGLRKQMEEVKKRDQVWGEDPDL